MSLAILCPQCHERFGAWDQLAGTTVSCPMCGTSLRVGAGGTLDGMRGRPGGDWMPLLSGLTTAFTACGIGMFAWLVLGLGVLAGAAGLVSSGEPGFLPQLALGCAASFYFAHVVVFALAASGCVKAPVESTVAAVGATWAAFLSLLLLLLAVAFAMSLAGFASAELRLGFAVAAAFATVAYGVAATSFASFLARVAEEIGDRTARARSSRFLVFWLLFAAVTFACEILMAWTDIHESSRRARVADLAGLAVESLGWGVHFVWLASMVRGLRRRIRGR